MQPGPEDTPKTFTVTLAAREWAAMVRLRDQMWPSQPLELMIRKLAVDELIRCGVLGLTAKNRSRGARATGGSRR